MTFQLAQWFDVTRPISKDDADLAEAQMALYAIKDGYDPDSQDAKRQYREMRGAVKQHNLLIKKEKCNEHEAILRK